MEQQLEQTTETTPLILEHEESRTIDPISEREPADGLSELERYRKDRDAGKLKPSEPPAEGETDAAEKVAAEKKAAERWQDPDTGDTYDMRHKVARRIKTVLEDRGKLRGEVEALRRERDDLMRTLMAQGMPKADAKEEATQRVNAATAADAEPDPGDLTKYPEGQYDRNFIRDQAKYAARQETDARFAQVGQQAQEQQRRQQFEQTVSKWNQTVPDASKKYADFTQVLEKFPRNEMNAPVADVLLSSPVGNDVVYLLGTNEGAWNAYYQQARTERDRYRVLYHIEAQIMNRDRAVKQKTQQTTSNAPAPTAPVHAGGSAGAGNYDWSRSDDPDQLARWRAQRKRTR